MSFFLKQSTNMYFAYLFFLWAEQQRVYGQQEGSEMITLANQKKDE